MTRKNKRSDTLYRVDCDAGVGIIAAQNIDSARKQAREDRGGLIEDVRLATKEDVDWVRSMGGRVPNGSIAKVRAGS